MTATDAIGLAAASADRDLNGTSPQRTHLRHAYRSRVWRAALGALGLFWVVAFLLLLR